MIKQYVVDAFTDKIFHGNQAAVCVLDEWLSEELMMKITKENGTTTFCNVSRRTLVEYHYGIIF